jgi:multicomponent Na+:H+ antiporter subunit G
MDPQHYVIGALLFVGLAFNFLGTLGLLRFPDVYTRLHTATKATTFGTIFLTLAVVVYGIDIWIANDETAHVGGLLIFSSIGALIALLITNPTGAHAIARAAYRSGVKPWGAVVDQLEIANMKTVDTKASEPDPGSEDISVTQGGEPDA